MNRDILDITMLKENTQETLHEAICNGVKDTQSEVLLLPLPSFLIMRTDQFDLLLHDPDLQQMYGSKDFLYRTPYNIMEVRVKDGEAAQKYAEEYGSL